MNKLIVIGTSAGGVETIMEIFESLKDNLDIPIIVVMHILETVEADFVRIFRKYTKIPIKEVDAGENIEKGMIYFAPPGHHLSVESDRSFSLSYEEKVNYSRPSVDITFISAAEVYYDDLTVIVLTGANADGASGAAYAERLGAQVIVQDPEEAISKKMPTSALAATEKGIKLSVQGICKMINELEKGRNYVY